ncbi:MAG: hypothetical protein WDW36_009049 [Sanguina aurantia]
MAPLPDMNLARLREEMARADGGLGVHAYLVPSEDPHMSEYAPDCFARRQFISRFMGSAGSVVVTADKALLWTDGRYFLQASTELGPEWTLMKAGTPDVPDLEDWLASSLPKGGRVGIDPFVHTVDGANTLRRKLEAAGRHLVPLLADGNLVDKVWPARTSAPVSPIRIHPLKWAGDSVSTKLATLRSQMKGCADVLLVTMLDEVAWLLNLRGSDVDHNPVFLSYVTVTADGATLFTDPVKVAGEAAAQLAEAGVQVKPYGHFMEDVKSHATAGSTIWLDPSKVSFAVFQAITEAADVGSQAVYQKLSPVVTAKAVKNASEIAGMQEAHLADAVAICQFLLMVEEKIAAGGSLTEVEVDLELTARRAAIPGYKDLSFPTIAGADSNGAIIHYRAKPETCKVVDSTTMLLLDSGGQYECGTTDITRTMHFGTPTSHQKRCFTRVLQGHIGLDTAVFPEGTPGFVIEAFARQPLWRDGLNYRHGTGHGVGAALNVHEGPQSISTRYHITTPLVAGMICSDEPGYYEEGGFGIRIENLLLIKEASTPFKFGGQSYFCFERLTQVPISVKMMDVSLMTPQEVAWVDGYHAEVWEKVSPRMEGQAELLAWLERFTQPMEVQLKY